MVWGRCFFFSKVFPQFQPFVFVGKLHFIPLFLGKFLHPSWHRTSAINKMSQNIKCIVFPQSVLKTGTLLFWRTYMIHSFHLGDDCRPQFLSYRCITGLQDAAASRLGDARCAELMHRVQVTEGASMAGRWGSPWLGVMTWSPQWINKNWFELKRLWILCKLVSKNDPSPGEFQLEHP